MVLRVIIKEGNSVLTTIIPLMNPRAAPTGSKIINAKAGFIPFIKNVAKT